MKHLRQIYSKHLRQVHFETGTFETFGTGSFETFETGAFETFLTGKFETFETGTFETFETGTGITRISLEVVSFYFSECVARFEKIYMSVSSCLCKPRYVKRFYYVGPKSLLFLDK